MFHSINANKLTSLFAFVEGGEAILVYYVQSEQICILLKGVPGD